MLKSESVLREMAGLFVATTLVLVLSSVLPQTANADAAKGKGTYSMLCFTCHGVAGEGNRALNSPALTALSQWYMVAQLQKFKNGQRGAHPKDVTGAQMAPMASTLANEAAMQDVSDYVRTLTSPKIEKLEIEGDVALGKDIYAKVCQECHGADGLGIQEKLSSALTGQNDWYSFAQLEKFKAGIRGTAEGDVKGAEMKAIADKLSEDEMKNVIAYISTLALPPKETPAK